jgi:hypothetical protein
MAKQGMNLTSFNLNRRPSMKQLLLITAISFATTTQVFAGFTCQTCPTAPAQGTKEQPADTQKKAEDQTEFRLAADMTPTMPSQGQTLPTLPQTTPNGQTPGKPAQDPSQTQFVLIGGTQPTTPEDAQKQKDEQKKAADAEQDEQKQPQLIA